VRCIVVFQGSGISPQPVQSSYHQTVSLCQHNQQDIGSPESYDTSSLWQVQQRRIFRSLICSTQKQLSLMIVFCLTSQMAQAPVSCLAANTVIRITGRMFEAARDCKPVTWPPMVISVPHHTHSRRVRRVMCAIGRGHTNLKSRELMWCYACSWDVRGDLTLNSMVQIHTSVTLLTSRDLAWSSGRLTCQHASQISAVAHISWDVTYVSSAFQTLPVVSRNGENAYWKKCANKPFYVTPSHQIIEISIWEPTHGKG